MKVKRGIVFISFFSGFILGVGLFWGWAQEPPDVHEGWRNIWVQATAPIPQEVENETQAKALAREAAIVRGQTHILKYVLEKKARSGKELKVAEIPSLSLKRKIRGMVKGAVVKSTRWLDGECQVRLSLSKKKLKRILKRN